MIPYESCSYLTGNYEYDFSGGAIEIADSGTSSVTTAPSVTQPEKTETQQVTTTVIPVTQPEKTEPLPGAISVLPVTQPENTETQPVTTTIIPVTTVPETQETEPETRLKGNISGNGEIDIYDVVEIAKEILGMRTFTEEEKKIADINGDGMVNLYDAIEIAGMLI